MHTSEVNHQKAPIKNLNVLIQKIRRYRDDYLKKYPVKKYSVTVMYVSPQNTGGHIMFGKFDFYINLPTNPNATTVSNYIEVKTKFVHGNTPKYQGQKVTVIKGGTKKRHSKKTNKRKTTKRNRPKRKHVRNKTNKYKK